MTARQVLREIQILRKLSAIPGSEKHITQLLDVKYIPATDSQTATVYLIMEYTKTNLDTFIEDNKGKYKEKHVLKIMAKLLRSIEFIHSSGVMHRDLKPSNILISKDFDVLICDFGLARTSLCSDPLAYI